MGLHSTWVKACIRITAIVALLISSLPVFSQIELLTNGDFSGPSGWSCVGDWQFNSHHATCNSCPGYAFAAAGDGSAKMYLSGTMSQTVTIPNNCQQLILSYYSSATLYGFYTGSEKLTVQIFDSYDLSLSTFMDLSITSSTPYQRASFLLPSAYYGHSISIIFNAQSSSIPTVIRVDDISLKCTTATTPCPTPAIPTSLYATPLSSNSIRLEWDYMPNTQTYNVYLCDGTFKGNTTHNSMDITNLSQNTNYFLKILGTNSCGSSNFTECASATTHNGGTNSSGSAPTVEFSIPLEANVGQDINITNLSTGQPNPSYLWICNNPNISFYPSSSALNPTINCSVNGIYQIKLVGTNSQGSNSIIHTLQVNQVSSGNNSQLPSVPQNFEIVMLSNNAALLNWNYVPNPTDYSIYLCNGVNKTKIRTVADAYIWVGNLISGAEYTFAITANNSYGSSGFSNTSTGTTVSGQSNSCIDLNDNYPYKSYQTFDCNAPNDHYDDFGFNLFNCTSWVAWMQNVQLGASAPPYKFSNRQICGVPLKTALGGAATWPNALPIVINGITITMDNLPAIGSVAWWQTGSGGGLQNGHVAIVNCIDGNKVTLTEYNAQHLDANNPDFCEWGYRSIFTNQSNTTGNRLPTGYIHFERLYNTPAADHGDPLVNQIAVYPNPAEQFVNFKIDATIMNSYVVRVINSNGNVVKIKYLFNTNTIDVNVSDLDAGVYTVEFTGNGIKSSNKFQIKKG